MGDLAQDTAVERVGPGRYRATVSADWMLWGPVGGYLAAIALRAAGAYSGMPLPASLSCQYLAPADFDTVDIEVESVRRSRNAASLAVRLSQRGTTVLNAQVWTIADDMKGPERRLSGRPVVPPPEQVDELALDRYLASTSTTSATATGTFWKNLELRTVYDRSRPDELEIHSWARFRPRAYFEDPWVDACRELITIDTAIFPAVAWALDGGRHLALSIDLYVAFHAPPPPENYLLVSARSTAAGAGLVSGIAQTRSADGTLTASGGSQLLCRILG